MNTRQALAFEQSIGRQKFIVGAMLFVFMALVGKVILLETKGHEHLVSEAKKRHVRQVVVEPMRGRFVDRNGELLAVSTPVDTVWADPKNLCAPELLGEAEQRRVVRKQWLEISRLLEFKKNRLLKVCDKYVREGRVGRYARLKRHVSPDLAELAMAIKTPGIYAQREYKRFYPTGPAAAHLIGFTDIDGRGQEGLEKKYNKELTGDQGKATVYRDSKGRFVEFVEQAARVENGKDIELSLDARLQYLASGYLEESVRKFRAAAGSAVVLKIPTGEVLALVGSPQFNPNDRAGLIPENSRNRAVADVQEPGSTIKPFTVALALEDGQYKPHTLIDTGKGFIRIGRRTIQDTKPHGVISLSDVVMMSSNVGTVKIAQSFTPEHLHDMLSRVGLGKKVGGFPTEVSGYLPKRTKQIDHVTQAYGYGLNATVIQMARAYTVFATDGELLPVTLRKVQEGAQIKGDKIFSESTVLAIRDMLARVVSGDGTAAQAAVPRYQVGGKTGTTHKFIDGAYSKDRYVSWFVGVAPIDDPQFVMAVMLDDPKSAQYYGGQVAAPVFSKLMNDALRLYNVKPNAEEIVPFERSKIAVQANAVDDAA